MVIIDCIPEDTMLTGKHECYCCGEVFEDRARLQRHEREAHTHNAPTV